MEANGTISGHELDIDLERDNQTRQNDVHRGTLIFVSLLVVGTSAVISILLPYTF
jgi:hypothetical protein